MCVLNLSHKRLNQIVVFYFKCRKAGHKAGQKAGHKAESDKPETRRPREFQLHNPNETLSIQHPASNTVPVMQVSGRARARPDA